ncbi:MAG TPA: hypothetical protein VKD71_00230 [Gemmataceae bacterium]|nr:hypothetical protein [Gemmataceae bacterium]
MIPRTIAQALFTEGRLVAESDDFDEASRPEAERIIEGFGLPPGVSAPDSLFAVQFGRRQIAIVSVAGRRFRFLVLARRLYDVIPDPFSIAERYPPQWENVRTLPTLEWPEEPLPRRTIEQLDAIFKNGDGPFLLGACQALVDSGRIALNRSEPDPKVCRDLWNLLPDSTRRHTWPATFAYSTALGFGLVVLPVVPESRMTGYMTEDQARDYPESRYERELQVAVEHNDQRTVDRLFARRSSAETLRLAIWIILAAVALSFVSRLILG